MNPQNQPNPSQNPQNFQNAPTPQDDAKEKAFANSALWATIIGAIMLTYYVVIFFARPDTMFAMWWLSIAPIVLGIGGVRSQTRRFLGIAGIVLGVAIVIFFFAAIAPNYRF